MDAGLLAARMQAFSWSDQGISKGPEIWRVLSFGIAFLLVSTSLGPDELMLPQLPSSKVLLADAPGFFGVEDCPGSHQLVLRRPNLITMDFQFSRVFMR